MPNGNPRKIKKNLQLRAIKAVRHVADPFFKSVLTEMARANGLTIGPTELQIPRSSLSDMFLHIPDGLKLQSPLLAFVRPYTIIELKGQNDPLNVAAFDLQMARVHLWHSQNSTLADYDRVLNVIVSSRHPDALFKYSTLRGSPFEKVNVQD